MSLPGYATWEKMAPLLGTSAHFRIQTLRASGGWDYYNVTEDWELGIRLQQAGRQDRPSAADEILRGLSELKSHQFCGRDTSTAMDLPGMTGP